MNTDEAWEKFKLNDSDRIGKSSTAAMLETILAQQNAINAKVDQILDENKGAPAEDAEEESADMPPVPPMGMGGASGMGGIPEMGGAPAPEGEVPPDAGVNPADSMPLVDESALLGGAPQDLNGGVPEPAPDMGGMSDLGDTSGDESGGLDDLLGGGDEGSADNGPLSLFSNNFEGNDSDDNVSAITDAINVAEDVDVQLGMTQVLQDYLSKKKGEGDMPMPDMSAPEGGNPMEEIIDAIAGGAPEGDVPPVGEDVLPEGDGAGIEDIMDALGGGEVPVEGDMAPPIPGGAPEGDEGMADIIDAIAGGGEGAPLGEEAPVDTSEEKEEPVKKSFSDKDKDDDDKESEKDPDEKDDESEDDKKDDDKKESKKKYPWDEYLDEDEADSKEEKSKDDDKGDDKKESKEDDMPEDEADAIIAIDEGPISDVDTAAIEEVIGKKMSDLIMALREILGDDADTDINPMISHGMTDLGLNTDPFMACGDSPEAMDTLTRSIDSLIEDRMRGLRGNDGKMYKVIKSEAQLRDEKTDKLKRSLSSNAVYHMTGRQVLDAMKGLEDNGVESVKKSFVNPYDVIVRSLDCAVGQEVTDKFIRSYGEAPTQGFTKANAYSNIFLEDYPGLSKLNEDQIKALSLFRNIIKYIYSIDESIKLDTKDRPKLTGKYGTKLVENAFKSRFNNESKDSDIINKLVLKKIGDNFKKYRAKHPDDINGLNFNPRINDVYGEVYWPLMLQATRDLMTVTGQMRNLGIDVSDTDIFANPLARVGNSLKRFLGKGFTEDKMDVLKWNYIRSLGKDRYNGTINSIIDFEKAYGNNIDEKEALEIFFDNLFSANASKYKVDGKPIKYGSKVPRRFQKFWNDGQFTSMDDALKALDATSNWDTGYFGNLAMDGLPLITSFGLLGVGDPFDRTNRYAPRTYDEISNIKEYRDPEDAIPITDIGSFAAQIGGDTRVFDDSEYSDTAFAENSVFGGGGRGRFGDGRRYGDGGRGRFDTPPAVKTSETNTEYDSAVKTPKSEKPLDKMTVEDVLNGPWGTSDFDPKSEIRKRNTHRW